LVRKKRFRGTFLTEEEFRVLSVLLSCGRVSDAARVLGRAQPTISIVKKRIEEKLNMAIETVKLAISLGLISRSELYDLISSINVHSGIGDFKSEWLLERYLSLLSSIIESTIKKTTPGLLELLEVYYTSRERKVELAKTLLPSILSNKTRSHIGEVLIG